MSSTDFLKEILNYDALDEAEKICEQEGLPDDVKTSLGFILHSTHHKLKEDLMISMNDTFFNMSFEYCEKLLLSLGFVEEYFELFKLWNYTDENEFGAPEFFTIWIHKNLPILVSFESYNNRVNSVKAYYAIKQTEENQQQIMKLPVHNRGALLRYGEKKETELVPQVPCSFDAREGLKFHLSQVKDFIDPDPWKEEPFLWLLNYEEAKENSDGYKKISLKKLKQCKSAQRIIGWEK